MLRFLRHYNKIFLGVFGMLLLLAWAVGGSLSQITNYAAREGTTWATWGPTNRKVTVADLDRVRQELRVMDELKRLFPNVPFMPIPGADANPGHWFLLTKEAEEAGLVGGEQDATPLLETMAKNMQPALEAQDLEVNADTAAALIASRAGTTPLVVRQTIARLNGVARMRDLMVSMAHYSDSRLRHAAAETLLGVACDVVVLDARKLAQPEVSDPTPEELADQLKKYGDLEPGKGEFGFGYRLPDRVKVEWIQISEAAVRAALQQSGGLDSLTLKRKFADDPTRFGAPANISGDPLAAFPQYESSVRQKVLDELVAERMKEIVKFAGDQFAQAQRGLKRDATGLLVLPADWASRSPDFKQLAATIANQYKIAAPTYGATSELWQGPDELRTLTGLGSASTTQFGDRAVTFAQLAARLKEFTKGDLLTANESPLIQKDVTTPPLTGANKDVYFARVIAADPSRAPADVQEAGPTLVNDVRAIARYSAIAKMADELKTETDAEGLRAIANRFGTTVEFVAQLREANPQFIGMGVKFPMGLPGLGNDPEPVHLIVESAASLPKTTPVADVPAEQRTYVIPLPKRLASVVARVSDVFPLTIEEYQTLSGKPQAQMALAGEGLQAALADAFSFESLTKRYNFKSARGSSADDEEPKPSTGAGTTKPAKAS